MSREKKMALWLTGLAVVAVLLHLLSGMLLPFVAGMAVAYFLDPVADRLEEAGFSRGLATFVILLAFFVAGLSLLMLLAPLLHGQILELAGLVPGAVESLRSYAEPLLERVRADLSAELVDEIRSAAGAFAGSAVKWLSDVLVGMWSGGVAFLNLLSLLVITPVVAFYLLRDWDLITARVDSWLPRPAAPAIRQQLSEIDRTLAAFVRGQASVCLVLAVIYGLGLSVIGLKSGLLVGIGAGLISFVPYVGAAIGLIVGVGIALFQFTEWLPVVLVAAVFLFGQTLESYVLTPRLVGDKVGLHPVWIIFALLAGGALFDFTGVLLAVPATAVIGVVARFGLERYLQSPLYGGNGGDGSAGR